MTDIDETKSEFLQLFGRLEHDLKRSGVLRNRKDAQADWSSFSKKDLGDKFFLQVKRNGIAGTLITKPPRKLMVENLQWVPENPPALENCEELIVRGICRVRNNFFHGEKFTGESNETDSNRDAILLTEALAVLKMVSEKFYSNS